MLLSAVLRCADLSGDPPENSVNGTAFADEGFWVQPAAWAAQHGSWSPLEPPVHRLAPLYTQMLRGVFLWLGPSLELSRAISALFGLGTCVLVARLLWPLGKEWAVLAMAAQGLSPWAVAFDRFATPEASCLFLLAGAAVALTWREEPSARNVAVALPLLALAAAAKPVALFFLPGAVAWLALAPGPARRRLYTVAAIALSMLAIGVATAGPGWTDSVAEYLVRLRAASGPAGSLWERYWALVRVPLRYEFATRHGFATAGLAFLLAGRGTLAVAELRLVRLAALWMGCWLLAMPLSVMSLFRFAYLSVPVTVLGVLGWRRLLEEGLPQGLGRRIGVGLGLTWGLALLSMQFSDGTGIRARIWLPVLASLALLLLAIERWSHARSGRLLLPAVAAGTIALLARDAGTRTHLVEAAGASLDRLHLDGRVVCGFEVPSLVVTRSPAVTALISTRAWNTDCSVQGRRADLVLVPEDRTCTRDGSVFVAKWREELLAAPRLAAFELPTLDPSLRGACRYLLVQMPPIP